MKSGVPTDAATKGYETSGLGGGGGFSLIELLTVIAIVGILSTLLLSAVSRVRIRADQAVCRNNLRQIAIAVEMYQDDAKRRPRTLSRLLARPTWLATEKSLICPDDPGLRSPPKNVKSSSWILWGNRANATQEPGQLLETRNPEAGTWEAELRERQETNRFSYLHPFTWQRSAFLRLGSGSQVGAAVCQLHGVRVSGPVSEGFYTDYEGWTLRSQRDGAVVSRKIFRSRNGKEGSGARGDTISVPLNREEYPWEFYVDVAPVPLPER